MGITSIIIIIIIIIITTTTTAKSRLSSGNVRYFSVQKPKSRLRYIEL